MFTMPSASQRAAPPPSGRTTIGLRPSPRPVAGFPQELSTANARGSRHLLGSPQPQCLEQDPERRRLRTTLVDEPRGHVEVDVEARRELDSGVFVVSGAEQLVEPP